MLVLSRNVGQRFRIGNDIWITLVQAKSGEARIGIEAPKDVTILREEVEDRDLAVTGVDVTAKPKPTATIGLHDEVRRNRHKTGQR